MGFMASSDVSAINVLGLKGRKAEKGAVLQYYVSIGTLLKTEQIRERLFLR